MDTNIKVHESQDAESDVSSRFWQRKKMAGCFDFRMRTSSFDLHQLAQRHKLSKITKLFRSRSDENVKSESAKASPKGSPDGTPNRRRFVRVVRNEQAAGEEYENPHVIRRFTQDFLQKQWQVRETSVEDPATLPYEVSGHTILKKHSSQDSNNSGENTPKHASFNESVEILEYDRKGKLETAMKATHIERLHEDEADYMIITYKEERYSGKDRCPMPSPAEKAQARAEAEAAAALGHHDSTSDLDQSVDSDSDTGCSCPAMTNGLSTEQEQSLSDSELEVNRSKSTSASTAPSSLSSSSSVSSSAPSSSLSSASSKTVTDKSTPTLAAPIAMTTAASQSKGASSASGAFVNMTSEDLSTALASKLRRVELDRQTVRAPLMAES